MEMSSNLSALFYFESKVKMPKEFFKKKNQTKFKGIRKATENSHREQYRYLDCHSIGIHDLTGRVQERNGNVLILEIRISKALPIFQTSSVRGRITRLHRPKKSGEKEKQKNPTTLIMGKFVIILTL